ncbi:MAG: hypothetical protein H6633_02040 [Anaerolineales bacterium]|nr:hypothetical protein [Anaerolineales bacterium]
MINLLFDVIYYAALIVLISLVAALAVAPFESMGWWSGWWLRKDDPAAKSPPAPAEIESVQSAQAHAPPAAQPVDHYVVYLTGIGGSTAHLNIPYEKRLLVRLREQLPTACVIDTIYPYSAANRGLTKDRLFARFWRFILHEKLTGHDKLGFMINLHNLLQVLVCADNRYGPFFSQGAAHVIAQQLRQEKYDFTGRVPLTIIGYSGGGQIAVGAAPYLAEVLPAPVQVISLAGVLSSTPKINRIDQLVHIYSDKDTVQRLGMIFPGRWRIAFTSAWNQGRRSGRITSILLPGVKHDGAGSYLDEKSFLDDGRSYLDRTVDTIVEVIDTETPHIPDA